jgi:type IV secretory pathway VirB10-like protein
MAKINVQGLFPPFIRRAIVSPGVGLGVIVIVAVATIPFWHLSSPDVAGIASRQLSGMQSTGVSVADDKPEAPDPSPLSVADVTTQAAPAKRAARPVASPSPVAAVQSVAVAQSVAVSQPQPPSLPQPPPPTAEPRPPADTHSTFGDPGDTEVDASKANSNVPDQARRDAPQVVAQSGVVGYVPATSPYEIREGTVIHCRWVVHADSEAVGHVEVQVIEAVYASNDPQAEVIPVGTLGEGVYSTANVGTTRFIVAWHRLNFPNGRKFEMGPQPATDLLGGTGANARVNSGLGKIFGSALMYTALNAAGQSLSRSSYLLGSSSITQQFSGQERQAKPTLYIDPTDRVDINVVSDLPLDRYEP